MISYKACSRLLLTLITLCFSTTLFANISFIVNKNTNTPPLTKQQLSLILQGKLFVYPSGEGVSLLDRPIDSPTRADVYKAITDKKVSQIRALWSKKVYAGQASFPEILASDHEIKEYVIRHPGAMGYVNTGAVDDSVKVVYSLNLNGDINTAILPPPAFATPKTIKHIANKERVKKQILSKPTQENKKSQNIALPTKPKQDKKQSAAKVNLASIQSMHAKPKKHQQRYSDSDKETTGGIPLDLSDIESSIDEYNDFCSASGKCEILDN